MQSIRESSNLKELSPMSSIKDSSPKLKNTLHIANDSLGYSMSRNGITLNQVATDSTI